MIDHIGLTVSDFEKSKAFYARALAPIGYELILELPAAVTGDTEVAGFGAPPKPDFWIGGGKANAPPIHVAFRAASRALVDAFHKAAIAAGGRDNGAPGLRLHYHPHYYGAFILDPDGHNIEAVCHESRDGPMNRPVRLVLFVMFVGCLGGCVAADGRPRSWTKDCLGSGNRPRCPEPFHPDAVIVPGAWDARAGSTCDRRRRRQRRHVVDRPAGMAYPHTGGC